ncbi:Essential recombination function protein [uncultured Caudovirales phage]|uniref:Essential recombination function protein n=1 Tax=uncultured Caudovirales phage TaxID=2100421 RepID=A0A6J5QFT9_9CAUD|nr:Essential recombination function protein [uncultured Caudovirales phage]CAB4181226.1 Essential recombination function protein [uncultured Caudovirales phage]CAB4196226.1 Essential recombination function protein [uncultured Caudovirales phage]CAB4211841.1 Essential recombination function protein [uncultured Caudovirales phage]
MNADTIKAIIATREQIGSLGKSAMNPHGRYKYVSIDSYYEKVSTTAAKNGLAWVVSETGFEVMSEVGKTGIIKATYDVALMHSSGAYIPKFTTLTIIHPIQGAQTVGSAMSYLDKVFMRQLFSVATGEKDSDADETNPDDIIGIGLAPPKKDTAPKFETEQAEKTLTTAGEMAETLEDLKKCWSDNYMGRNFLREHDPEALKRATDLFSKRRNEFEKETNNGN